VSLRGVADGLVDHHQLALGHWPVGRRVARRALPDRNRDDGAGRNGVYSGAGPEAADVLGGEGRMAQKRQDNESGGEGGKDLRHLDLRGVK